MENFNYDDCVRKYSSTFVKVILSNAKVEIIKNFRNSKFSIEKQLIEKIKTLTYNIYTAFGRTDQLLRQIESKLNKEE